MFQKFDTVSTPNTAASRVEKLRALLDDNKIDGYLIPKSDEYLGEYIAPYAERLAWLTSFTGSAGSALILKEKAVVFTDGRYTSQVVKQCDNDLFDFADLVACPPQTWIKEQKLNGIRIGVDPWLLPSSSIKRLKQTLEDLGGELIFPKHNLVDQIWDDQPEPPLELAFIQPIDLAGTKSVDKIDDIKQLITSKKQDAFIVADPTSLAWIFNIRGNDIAHTPVCLCRAIIHANGLPQLFIDPKKLDTETKAYLTQISSITEPSELENTLMELGAQTKEIALDPTTAPFAISSILEANGAKVTPMDDPAIKARAIKNNSELDGARNAHLIDGAAMVTFVAWLKTSQIKDNAINLDEIKVAQRLEAIRTEIGQAYQNPLKDISFDTISGSGPNAAIIHYRVDQESNRALENNEMILVDSGGQYVNGTTDITRTIGLGDVPHEQRKLFTLVLKGMIDITLARFPKGTRGVDIDILARSALWQAGMDYAHGTGHGVGSYLSVHEGPQSISRRSMVTLKPGMILSNEPGYYRDGAFGIRIENLVAVQEPAMIKDGEIEMLGFETLTLCPIDRDLIITELLSAEQLAWLNAYHSRVWDEISPLLSDESSKDWLKFATAMIS